MAPTANEPEVSNSHQSGVVGPTGGNKPQPAALEIPVLVNGARTVAGTDKREPFSENTQTVLVFANGAVIRLSSAVASGQLLFLTNEKTKKEVVCQVVKATNSSGGNGYVELEFTEAAPGFWGLRFSTGAPSGSTQSAVKTVSTSATPLLKSLEEKLTDTKAKLPSTPVPEALTSSETKPAAAPKDTHLAAVPSERQIKELHAAPVVSAQPPVNESKIPTLSEFLTNGANGAELKPRDKTKNETKEIAATENAKSPKVPTAPSQNGLTAALAGKKSKAEAAQPTATENPAPGTYTFDFAADQVKIPAWLEPLARNSANVAAPETGATGTKSAEKNTSVARLGENPLAEKNAHEQVDVAPETKLETEAHGSSAGQTSEYSEKPEAVLTLSSEGPVPNFGSSLALDGRSGDKTTGAGGSRTGLVLTLAAIVLLLAVAAFWYWYSNQTTSASTGENSQVQPNSSVTPETNSGTSSAEPANRASLSATPSAAAYRSQPSANVSDSKSNSTSSNASVGTPVPASTFGNSTGSIDNSAKPNVSEVHPDAVPVKKPALGDLHLAAPVVKRASASRESNSSEPEPAIGENGLAGGEANAMSVLANKSKQPSAPIAVGGDVKVARLLSAVPPVYPQMARTQRISGDVVIDALIDANGRVSAMKVVSGPTLLHEAAKDALRQWKYQPATLNGTAMPMHLGVTVQFKLH